MLNVCKCSYYFFLCPNINHILNQARIRPLVIQRRTTFSNNLNSRECRVTLSSLVEAQMHNVRNAGTMFLTPPDSLHWSPVPGLAALFALCRLESTERTHAACL